jgi:hypothetical protein
MPAEHERFEAKVTVLIESVRHHIEEEEGEMFPKVRQALGRPRPRPRPRPSPTDRRGDDRSQRQVSTRSMSSGSVAMTASGSTG